MKVLHIGHGFMPWRRGGSLEYVEDLMDIQSKKGLDVYYFFSGRVYPIVSGPKLIRWKKSKIKMFEVINSPLIPIEASGIKNPELYLNKQDIEEIYVEILEEIRPDLVHFQELIALPSSLIKITKKYGIPIVFNLHDYSLLCPTIKLYRYDNINCKNKTIGQDCVICCENAGTNNNVLTRMTIAYSLEKLHLPIYTIFSIFKKIYKLYKNLKVDTSNKYEKNSLKDDQLAKLYQNRRDENIKTLKDIDVLIAHSRKAKEIYEQFLNTNNIITLHPAVKHLELISPKHIENIKYPINFFTLNGCSSIEKGAEIICNALKILQTKGLDKYFNLHIYGSIHEKSGDYLLKHANVYYHGSYKLEDLDELLRTADVGIVPSVWEEIYGFVGIEFLKKGIPIISNNKGGMPDYTVNDLSGWINESSSSEELADLMELIIKNPKKISELNKKILKLRIKTIEDHFNEISGVYQSLLNE